MGEAYLSSLNSPEPCGVDPYPGVPGPTSRLSSGPVSVFGGSISDGKKTQHNDKYPSENTAVALKSGGKGLVGMR